MYLYFNANGDLKEILTDETFRGGDARDYIYFFVEDEPSFNGVWVKYKLPDGTWTEEEEIYTYGTTQKVGLTLPKDRNLKYFSYKHTYEEGGETHTGYLFYKIEVGSSVLSSSEDDNIKVPNPANLVLLQIRVVARGTSIPRQYQIVPFSVQSTIGLLTDDSINSSQYNYLIGHFYNRDQIDSLLEDYQTKFVYTDNISDSTTLKTLYDTYGNLFIGKISASHISGYYLIQINSVGGDYVRFNFFSLEDGAYWNSSHILNTTTITAISNSELAYKNTTTPVYKHTISLGTSNPSVVLYSSSKDAITNDPADSTKTGTADKLVIGYYKDSSSSISFIAYDSILSWNGGKLLAIRKYNGNPSDLKSGTQLNFSTFGINGYQSVDITLGTITDTVEEV